MIDLLLSLLLLIIIVFAFITLVAYAKIVHRYFEDWNDYGPNRKNY